MQDNYSSGRINEEITINNDGTAQIAKKKLTYMFWMGQKSQKCNLILHLDEDNLIQV